MYVIGSKELNPARSVDNSDEQNTKLPFVVYFFGREFSKRDIITLHEKHHPDSFS